ncbi:hypothetical protein FGO68_gene9770 [Halteria grandinella]|uniref:Uncharacterized protein n=1 Tax=Halteria grandinella TaxID=5974 RepID=A0A8J8T7U1_HALGN|nr:hypothetical protein FGO68_gene9770 [Halteria grandinella]
MRTVTKQLILYCTPVYSQLITTLNSIVCNPISAGLTLSITKVFRVVSSSANDIPVVKIDTQVKRQVLHYRDDFGRGMCLGALLMLYSEAPDCN